MDQHAQQLAAVQEKLDRLAAALETRNSDSPPKGLHPGNDVSGENDLRASTSQVFPPHWNQPTTDLNCPIPTRIVAQGITLYFQHFHNQPYPLFSGKVPEAEFLATNLPKIVLYPMLTLSLRASTDPLFYDRKARAEMLGLLSNIAWGLLTKAYSSSEFGLSYFQGLCLLAQSDFATGNLTRSRAQIALGLALGRDCEMVLASVSNGRQQTITSYPGAIIFTLLTMERLFDSFQKNITLPSLNVSFKSQYESAPCTEKDLDPTKKLQLQKLWTGGPLSQHIGINSANFEVVRIWEAVIADIGDLKQGETTRFWLDGSPWNKAQSAILDLEIRIYPHRYGAVNSLRHESHLLSYFGPWIFLQIVSSGVHCCLNHPFILFMRTRQLHGQVPLTLLQKSQENAMIHSQWVIRHISEASQAGQGLYDPIIGQMVAIAATIQLEHTVSEQETMAASAKQNFETARAFLRKMSQDWPNMLHMYRLIEEFEMRLNRRHALRFARDRYNGAIPREELQDVNLGKDDIELMWQLFDYASLSGTEASEWSPLIPHGSTSPQQTSTTACRDALNSASPISHIYTATEKPNRLADDALEDVLNSQIPAFELDPAFTEEWSLLGKPWSAYMQDDTLY
ncbi:hypothetical protein GQ53DRAFT_846430 [Thozetella sp. PMI_491]|nr:hypothetical protein GQ53DRAFT_846430 [Thozetella sp. PMI_491]